MTKEITIYSDYVCPYCLLAERVVNDAIEGQDIEIKWRPYELRPEPVPTLRVEDPYLPQVWKHSVYPLAERLGIPIRLPTISPQPRTDKAFEVFAIADDQGLGHAFTMRAFRAFFQEEQDIGSLDTLADLAQDIGLDRDTVLAALAQGTYRQRQRDAQRHAVEEANINSVPTLIVGERTFTGVPDPAQLQQAIAALDVADASRRG